MRIPQTPPDAREGFRKLLADPKAAGVALTPPVYSPTVRGRYVHWDKLRRLAPPEGVTLQNWWAVIKLARDAQCRALPLRSADGVPFKIASTDPVHMLLSELDRNLSGNMAIPAQLTTPGTRDRYQINALIEESITSSQLEGAATTRKVAANMLRSGRAPRDKGERMIVNNFSAMRYAKSIAAEPLTPEAVFEIHSRVTQDTLDNPEDAGRLRTSDDVFVRTIDGQLIHTPPPAKELERRMQNLCYFANGKSPDYYIHPLVRAALLHFWLGYDHPFVDGNGRTARALFYWSALHEKYWLCEYVSVSQILKSAPAQYARAYMYSETDANDATYFVLYHLDVLKRAIQKLHSYLQEKQSAILATNALMRRSAMFNHRQLAMLSHALRNPDAQYSATSHATSHDVTRQTARTDLKELAGMGLLIPVEVGNGYFYFVPPDFEDRLRTVGGKNQKAR